MMKYQFALLFALALSTLSLTACNTNTSNEASISTTETTAVAPSTNNEVSNEIASAAEENIKTVTEKKESLEEIEAPKVEDPKAVKAAYKAPESKVTEKKSKKISQTTPAPSSNKATIEASKEPVAPTPAPKANIIEKETPSTQVTTPEPKKVVEEIAPVAKPDHSKWDAILRKYVSASGKVNYKGIKADKAALEGYLKELEQNPIESSWSRNEKMAYWINAYNAYTVKLIVDNYPLTSITKLHGGKPWDVKWIKLGGKTYSLNNIENDILRPQYKDARIHFAVNCAARSCPPLLNKAWTAANLNSNFQKQAKAFVNSSKFNSISADKVVISKIFEWYAGDFGNIITYLNKFANTKINAGAKVSYQEYDWQLNE